MGVFPSTSASIGAKLEIHREVRLQAPIAVTANKVGKIYAFAMYTILNMQETPNFVPKTNTGNRSQGMPSIYPKNMIVRPPIIETEKSIIVDTRIPK